MENYIPQEQRKKILLITDIITLPSGVGTIGKEIVYNSLDQFNWVNLGCSINNPNIGKILNYSKSINELKGMSDAYLKIYPYGSYGDMKVLRQILEIEKPDAILLITDPRYFEYIWRNEHEIRKQVPIIYYNIWDQEDLVPYYNLPYYESCDALLAISKATFKVNTEVLKLQSETKLIKYIPHGKDETIFKPLDKSDPKLLELKKQFIPHPKEDDFVLFFNSRNMYRKNIPNIMLAWKIFMEQVNDSNCYFILHTNPQERKGTDLEVFKEDILRGNFNIIFDNYIRSEEEMNMLYNIADGTILASSNEGWGLSLTESLLAGTPIIASFTGGMKDQIGVGNFSTPIYPKCQRINGNLNTPYIYEDVCSTEDISSAIQTLYYTPKDKRQEFGLEGREYAINSGFTSKTMSNEICNAINEVITNWSKPDKCKVVKI